MEKLHRALAKHRFMSGRSDLTITPEMVTACKAACQLEADQSKRGRAQSVVRFYRQRFGKTDVTVEALMYVIQFAPLERRTEMDMLFAITAWDALLHYMSGSAGSMSNSPSLDKEVLRSARVLVEAAQSKHGQQRISGEQFVSWQITAGLLTRIHASVCIGRRVIDIQRIEGNTESGDEFPLREQEHARALELIETLLSELVSLGFVLIR
jgi:hypothetical protein